MAKQLAIIKGVHFGVGDRGYVCMWFSAYVDEAAAALQVLSVDAAVKLIKAMNVDNVDKLNGKPVWVNVNDNTILYDSPAKI